MGSSKRAQLAERMKVFGLLCLVGVACANSISRAPTRDEKLFSVFQIVKFSNDVCTASDGNMGTCYTSSECSTIGGTAKGNCAASFGVCCTANVDSCSTTGMLVKMNNTYIQNAGYPNTVATGQSTCASSRQARSSTTYSYMIQKYSSDIEQVRLDFLDVEIDTPSSGSCANSTLTVTLNALGTQKWNILVSFFTSDQTDYLAPRGCLQYYRNNATTISTFNYNSGNGELLTDHMYSICLEQVDGFCDVQMTAGGFMLGGTSGSCSSTDDKLVLGTNTFCGSTFGTSNSFTWAYSGSYTISVMSGTTNTAMNDGFSISYLFLPC